MDSTLEALAKGDWSLKNGCLSYEFGDGYELCLEPLLFDGQMYLALYKDQNLLIPKICVKAGKKL